MGSWVHLVTVVLSLEQRLMTSLSSWIRKGWHKRSGCTCCILEDPGCYFRKHSSILSKHSKLKLMVLMR